MKQPTLWMLRRGSLTHRFYIGTPTCGTCKKETFSGFYFANWVKRNYQEGFICGGCAKEWQKMNVHMQEFMPVLVAEEPPIGAIPVNVSYPGVTPTNINGMDIREGRTVDRTRAAGRPEFSIGDALLGKSESQIALEESWKDDVEGLLEFHADPQNLLAEEERRRIE